MKTEKQIKYILELLKSKEGYKVWKKVSFTPNDYTDVIKTLMWVLK